MRTMGKRALLFSFLIAMLPAFMPAASAFDKVSSRSQASPRILLPLAFDTLISAERKLVGHKGKIISLAISSDSRQIATGGDDKSIILWDRKRGEPIWWSSDLPDKVTETCFSAKNDMLIAAIGDDRLFFWDAADGKPIAWFKLKEELRTLTCNPATDQLATAHEDGSIVFWDLGLIRATGAEEAGSTIQSAKKGNNRKSDAREGGYTALRDRALSTVIKNGAGKTDALAFTPDGKRLAYSGGEKMIHILDITSTAISRSLAGGEKDLGGVVITRDGKHLLAVEDKKWLLVWDMANGKLLRRLGPSREDIIRIASNVDGTVVTTSDKKGITFWNIDLPTQTGFLSAGRSDLATHFYATDGSTLITADRDGEATVWILPGILSMVALDTALQERTRVLQLERDQKISSLLSAKGEFESKREYERRKKRQQKEEQALRQQYERKLKGEKARFAGQARSKMERLYPCILSGTLGGYDAELGAFQAEIGGVSINVPVPPAKAEALAKHKDRLTFSGKVRYHDAGRVELVNAIMTDALTGDRYPFGIRLAEAEGGGEMYPPSTSVPSPRKSLPLLEIRSVSLIEPSGNGALDAGETGSIRVEIRNSGAGGAEGVTLAARMTDAEKGGDGLTFDPDVVIGPVAAGETRILELSIYAGEEAAGREARMQLTALEQDGFDSKPLNLNFTVRAMVPPDLNVAKVELMDADGHRKITKGKEITATLTLRNSGGGAARGVRVLAEVSDPNIRLLSESEHFLDIIKANETKKAIFTFAVTRRYAGPAQLPLTFVVEEERPRYSVRPDLRLVLNQEAPEIRTVRVAADEQAKKEEDVSVPPLFSIARRGFTSNDLAIVIGIDRYQELPRSEFAYNDARSVKEYLHALGFAERNIEFLAEERATLSAIIKSVETWLPNRMKEGARVLFYYSGHGAPDPASGEAYLVPYDGDPAYLGDTGYPVKRLYEKLSRLRASEVIVIMDSCFSGTGGRSVLAKGARPLVLMADTGRIPSNMAVLSSTQGGQISTSLQDKEHGAFTYYLLKAIKEGKEDIQEVYQYLRPLVEDAAKGLNVSQSPSLIFGSSREGGFRLLMK